MKSYCWIGLCFLLVFLTACNGPITTSVAPSIVTSPPPLTSTVAATASPTITLTSAPSLTPTQTLTPSITPFPTLEPISAKNSNKLGLLYSIGKGALVRLAQFSDPSTLVVTTGKGVFLYDATTFAEKEMVEIATIDWVRRAEYNAQSKRGVFSDQNNIIVWDFNQGKSIKYITGSGYGALNADGSLLAVSTDKTKVLNLSSGEEIALLEARACGLTFSPDSSKLLLNGCATRSGNQPTSIWDVSSGKKIREGTFQGDFTRALFSPEGRYIAVNGSRDVLLWDMTTWQFRSLKGLRYPSDGIAFSPNGRFLAAGIANNPTDTHANILVWEIESGTVVYELHTGRADDLLFSADGKTLYVNNGNVLAIDIETAEIKGNLDGFGSYRSPLVGENKNGQMLLAFSNSNRVNLWNLTARQPLEISLQASSPMAFLSNGSQLITQGDSGEVLRYYSEQNKTYARSFQLWNLNNGELLKEYSWKSLRSPIAPSISSDQKYLASGGNQLSGPGWKNMNTVRIWDIQSGDVLFNLYQIELNDLEFSPDNQRLVTVGAKQIKLWNLENGELLFEVYQQSEASRNGEISKVAFSPDGKWLITGGRHAIEIWDVATMQSVRKIDIPSRSIIISPIGDLFASISPENKNNINSFDSVRFFSWAPQKVNISLTFFVGSRRGSSASAILSPDGRLLITRLGSDPATLWNVVSRQELKKLLFPYYSTMFSPNGKLLIFSQNDGSLQIFGIRN